MDDLAGQIGEIRRRRELLEASKYRAVDELEAYKRQIADVGLIKGYAKIFQDYLWKIQSLNARRL